MALKQLETVKVPLKDEGSIITRLTSASYNEEDPVFKSATNKRGRL